MTNETRTFLIERGDLEFEFEASCLGIAALVSMQSSNGRLDVVDGNTGEIVVPAFLELSPDVVKGWWWNNARGWSPMSIMKHRRSEVLTALRSMVPRGPADNLEAIRLMERLRLRIDMLSRGVV